MFSSAIGHRPNATATRPRFRCPSRRLPGPQITRVGKATASLERQSSPCLGSRCVVGERPVWCSDEAALRFVDIKGVQAGEPARRPGLCAPGKSDDDRHLRALALGPLSKPAALLACMPSACGPVPRHRIKGLLLSQGIRDYEPMHRNRRERLEQLTTGDGRTLSGHIKAQPRTRPSRVAIRTDQGGGS